jgi:hypothetical protein
MWVSASGWRDGKFTLGSCAPQLRQLPFPTADNQLFVNRHQRPGLNVGGTTSVVQTASAQLMSIGGEVSKDFVLH